MATIKWSSADLERAFHDVTGLRDRLNQHEDTDLDALLKAALDAVEEADCEIERAGLAWRLKVAA